MERDNSPPCFSVGHEPRGTVVRRDRDLQNVGPFNYNKGFADRHTKARWSMGTKLDSLLNNRFHYAPPCNNYDPVHIYSKEKSPDYKIGTSPRSPNFDIRKAKLVPGPNAYDVKPSAFVSEAKESRFHQGIKLNHDDQLKYVHSVPGPGTHEPKFTMTKNRS